MENNNLIAEKIASNISNSSLYKVLIYDRSVFKKYDEEAIISKCNKLNLKLVDNTIGKEIRIIEICDELIKRQSYKLDKEDAKLPLIALESFPYGFVYERELTSIKGYNEIIMELIDKNINQDKFYHMVKYFILTPEQENYIDKDVIYISCQYLLDLDIENIQATDFKIDLYNSPIVENISMVNIIPTYMSVMNPRLKYDLIKEDEQTYILRSAKYDFKILLILNYNELQNDNIDISNYELIIEVDDLEISRFSVLKEQNVNNIYKKLKKPGLYFKR